MAVADSDRRLIDQWIEPNPNRVGVAEARLKHSGVSVWAIVGYLLLAKGDVDGVAKDYDVPVEAVQAAWEYYLRHSAEINARLAENRGDAC